MKTLFAIRFLFLVLLINACDGSKETSDESSLKAKLESSLKGSWYLTHISGGFAGIDEVIEQGDIHWTFHPATASLEVENNVQSGILYDGLPSGIYSYSIELMEKGQFLYIGGEEFGGFTIDSSVLLIDQNVRTEGSGADLFILELTR